VTCNEDEERKPLLISEKKKRKRRRVHHLQRKEGKPSKGKGKKKSSFPSRGGGGKREEKPYIYLEEVPSPPRGKKKGGGGNCFSLQGESHLQYPQNGGKRRGGTLYFLQKGKRWGVSPTREKRKEKKGKEHGPIGKGAGNFLPRGGGKSKGGPSFEGETSQGGPDGRREEEPIPSRGEGGGVFIIL